MKSRREIAPAAAHTEVAGLTNRPNLALLVVVTGVLITAVDTTIVVLALPEIQRTFHIGLASVIWVIIGYLFIITLVSTQVGRLGDMFGRVSMYKMGFVIFVVASALCALSWNELSLIIFRLIQGIGGAFIAANSGAVIADTFPRDKRGRAYGFNAIGYSTGAVLGVVLGGTIVTYISWRWIFWINLPIGIAAVLVAQKVLRDTAPRISRRIDWWGALAVGLGLFGLLWAMVDLISEEINPTIVGFFVGGVLCLVAFWQIERHTTEPLLDFDLFKIPTITPSFFAAMLQSLANFAVLFLLLMYLQGVQHLDPIRASLLLVPGYIIGGVFGPLSGRYADRHGAVVPATFGLGLQILALIAYAQLGLHTSLWYIVIAYTVGAIGGSCFFPANNSAVMKVAPSNAFGITSGLLRTFANIGMVFSFAVAILIASASISRHVAFAIFVGSSSISPKVTGAFVNGLHAAFYASTSLMVVAAILSASRRRVPRAVPIPGLEDPS
ncbi:MAG TPA: MFS transporter [Acidimicrobiales bacterium]|nr:MFS transporter [Acidimicrobiales bacterium]